MDFGVTIQWLRDNAPDIYLDDNRLASFVRTHIDGASPPRAVDGLQQSAAGKASVAGASRGPGGRFAPRLTESDIEKAIVATTEAPLVATRQEPLPSGLIPDVTVRGPGIVRVIEVKLGRVRSAYLSQLAAYVEEARRVYPGHDVSGMLVHTGLSDIAPSDPSITIQRWAS